jgi:chemotaxis protein MotB
MLSLERGKSAELSADITRLDGELTATRQAGDAASSHAAALGAALAQAITARDAATSAAATAQARLSDANTELTASGRRTLALQSQLASASARADQQAADQVRALTASRDQLSAQLTDAHHMSDAALARIALLNAQIDAMRAQLAQLAAALDTSQKAGAAKDVRIADLGAKLNAALISKVAELQRYRSEFFGRLRQVLAGRPGIAVVGDRFVFQSEVLFPAGSADLSAAGREQITQLAATLKSIARDIPADIPWVLRVDGHADRQAIRGRFADNWSLSAERAITVVRLLAADGVASNRLAAAGFGEYQPIDAGTTPSAFARNRRIELRLTDR